MISDGLEPSQRKAGLGWGNNGAQNMDQFLSAKVSCSVQYYNWNFQPSDDASGLPVEFVPMLWGQTQAEEFSDTIVSTLQSTNATVILSMNEPQESNLTPEQAVELWKQHLEPLKAAHGVRLGSPAPSGAPGSWQWLTAFLQQCGEECTVDFLVLHWYGTNATAFKEFLVDYHTAVTEWACQNMAGPDDQCSMSDVSSFMQETQGFMDNTDWIERYAWYGSKTPDAMHGVNTNNAMMNSSGRINALGTQYIAAPAPPPVFTND
ncbi:glycoside hydrolase family 128 protein [Favolaschia claudopus]|uniref:Glycoside hydrolase family 128 protein n=1 Tax=Favolaschia claudopus TaxID=2862362 RepID=A0AAV9Z7C3_9AGAR